MKLFQVLFILAFTLTSTVASGFSYNPQARPEVDLEKAHKAAAASGKTVLMVFGSDWCTDCRSLNKKFADQPLNKTITDNFEVVHVDIGNWDKNMAFANQFGKPVSNGIPSIVILDKKKKIRFISMAGELATARSSSTQSLNDWFLKVIKESVKKG